VWIARAVDGLKPNLTEATHKANEPPTPPAPRTYCSSKAFENSDLALILETLEQAGWIVVDCAAQLRNWD